MKEVKGLLANCQILRTIAWLSSSKDREIDAGDSPPLLNGARPQHPLPSRASAPSFYCSRFQEYGLSAHYTDYDVLLWYPLHCSLILSVPTKEPLMISLKEEPAEGDHYSSNPKVMPTFHGYAPLGNVSAEVVYANYGRVEDFQKLAELGINVKDAIVIAKYRGTPNWPSTPASAISSFASSTSMDICIIISQVGSMEWVEQNIDLLGVNAVAYLNLDSGVHGPGFSAGASPQLDGLLQEVTKQVSFANSAGDVLLLTILIRPQVKDPDLVDGTVFEE
ncbi:unnamed protein product [Sphagnum jensenii]|uniref:Uncharacterized protein n=1 Tax=Sphagnum jensenii TaxID=128206 RepID=A0ABP0XIX6_9BRYO